MSSDFTIEGTYELELKVRFDHTKYEYKLIEAMTITINACSEV